MTRKEFLTGGGRIIILTLMLFGVGFLAFRGRVSLKGYCDDSSQCAGCRLNNYCKEPLNQTTSNDGKQNA